MTLLMKYERNQKTEKEKRKKFSTKILRNLRKLKHAIFFYFSKIVPIFITRMGGGNI